MMLKLKLQYFGHLMWRGKDSDAGRDWGQEEKETTEDEMAGWHCWLDGRESEWTLGVGDGQGGLACCNSWGRKESDTTERLNWTELNWVVHAAVVNWKACWTWTQTTCPPTLGLSAVTWGVPLGGGGKGLLDRGAEWTGQTRSGSPRAYGPLWVADTHKPTHLCLNDTTFKQNRCKREALGLWTPSGRGLWRGPGGGCRRPVKAQGPLRGAVFRFTQRGQLLQEPRPLTFIVILTSAHLHTWSRWRWRGPAARPPAL